MWYRFFFGVVVGIFHQLSYRKKARVFSSHSIMYQLNDSDCVCWIIIFCFLLLSVSGLLIVNQCVSVFLFTIINPSMSNRVLLSMSIVYRWRWVWIQLCKRGEQAIMLSTVISFLILSLIRMFSIYIHIRRVTAKVTASVAPKVHLHKHRLICFDNLIKITFSKALD